MSKGSGAQVVFSSVLLVRGRSSERRRKIEQLNAWLSNLCHVQGFGFYDHGSTFKKLGLLGADGIHLTNTAKLTRDNQGW